MAVKLTGNGVYYHRTTGLPASGTAWTICGWARSASFAGPPHVLMTMRTAASTIQFELIHHTGASQMVIDGSARVAFASRPATGEWFFFWVQCSGSGAGAMTAGWIRRDDAAPVTVSAQISNSGVPGNLYMGGSAGDPSDTRFAAVKMWDAVLTAAELENERWQILPRKAASLLFFTPMVDSTLANNVTDYSGNAVHWTANGSAAVEDGPPISWGSPPSIFPYVATTDTSVAPGLGVLAISGYAPTLSYDSNVAPGKGVLAISGYAPTLSIPSAVAPGKGSLEITGFAPTLAGASSVSPGKGTLEISGYAPTFSFSSSVTPGKGALAITGYAPSFTSGATSVTPGVGRLTIRGFAPTLQGLPVDFGFIPPVNNLEQLRKQANALLSRVYGYMPGYGPTLPTIDPDLDGRLFVKTSDQTVYQQQYGAWVAVDMTP